MSADLLLTLGSAVFILGSPLAVFFLWLRVPRLRGRLSVILGALTPAVMLCAYSTARYLFGPESESYRWAFYAQWAMTAPAYAVCLVLGIALSFLQRPARLAVRYLLGFVSPLSVGLLLAAL